MQFHLEDMTCGGCARTVTKTIQMIDPNAKIVTDPPTRRVEVQTSASQEQIAAALSEAGFPPRAQEHRIVAGKHTGRPMRARALRRTWRGAQCIPR